MMGLKLIHVSKRGLWFQISLAVNHVDNMAIIVSAKYYLGPFLLISIIWDYGMDK